MEDCCGGAPVHPFPTGPSVVYPCENYLGTVIPLLDVEIPLMAWEGFADASTILAGEITWSPPENPATVTLVEIRPPRRRNHVAWPDACFNAPPDCAQKLDLTIARNWRHHAHMLWLSYDDPPVQGNYLQSFLTCPVQSQVIPNNEGLTPGTTIAFTDEWNLVYISGTTTFQQKALQASSSIIGPTDFGDFSTLALWFAAATAVRDRIIATGFPIRNKWFLAGHSYGSAIASILAGVMRVAFPEREIRLFTIGAPCPGDHRLRTILEPLQQTHLQNVGDPVCSMPPRGQLFEMVSWLLDDDLRNAWGNWEPHNRRFALFPDFTRQAVNEGSVDFATLSTLTDLISTGGTVADYEAHAAGVYADRCNHIAE